MAYAVLTFDLDPTQREHEITGYDGFRMVNITRTPEQDDKVRLYFIGDKSKQKEKKKIWFLKENESIDMDQTQFLIFNTAVVIDSLGKQHVYVCLISRQGELLPIGE